MSLKKALFLDRDGIINEDVGYTYKIDDFVFRNGIFDLCRWAQDHGFCLIVVTNQAGIGRGYYTEGDFHLLTNWMIEQFQQQGIKITAVEFCPYHPVHGLGDYKRDNFRRKPQPGMILDACRNYDIDPKQSIMIGDKVDDMIAAYKANVKMRILLSRETIINQSCPPQTKIFSYNDLGKVSRYICHKLLNFTTVPE